MPSNEQVITNLRTLLASEVLNPRSDDVSEPGRQLARDVKTLMKTFIELLKDKNDQDQIQEFFWHLSKSRVSINSSALSSQAAHATSQANTRAGKLQPSTSLPFAPLTSYQRTIAFAQLVAYSSQMPISVFSSMTSRLLVARSLPTLPIQYLKPLTKSPRLPNPRKMS